MHLHNLSRGFSVDLASPQPSALWVSVVSVPEPSLLRAAFCNDDWYYSYSDAFGQQLT